MACCNAILERCDPAGTVGDNTVLIFVNSDGAPPAYKNLDGTDWTGDPTTLTNCAEGSVSKLTVTENADGTTTVEHNPGDGSDTTEFTYGGSTVTLNQVDGDGTTSLFDPAVDCIPLGAFQKIIDHEANEIVATGCGGNPLTLHRSMVIAEGHVAGVTGVGGGNFIGSSHADSDDTAVTGVTTHHRRVVISSETSTSTGDRSAAVSSQNVVASGVGSTVLASNANTAASGIQASAISTSAVTLPGIAVSAIASNLTDIAGVRNGVIADTDSNVDGNNNFAGASTLATITAGVTRSSIIAGQGSTISTGTDNSAIIADDASALSGNNSLIAATINGTLTGARSSIIGGQGNSVDTDESGTFVASDSTVGTGQENSAIIAHQGGTITGSTFNNLIAGGAGATVFAGATDSATVAGQGSVINGPGAAKVIVGGETNSITGTVGSSSILVGRNNVVDNAQRAAIIGGDGNAVASGHDNSVVVGGAGISTLAPNWVYVPNLNIDGIPTAAAGLNPGDVWSNGGVLTIV